MRRMDDGGWDGMAMKEETLNTSQKNSEYFVLLCSGWKLGRQEKRRGHKGELLVYSIFSDYPGLLDGIGVAQEQTLQQ